MAASATDPGPADANFDSMLSSTAPELFDAIGSFIRQNANFESSLVQTRVVNEIGAATDIMQVFAIPMQNTLLTMDGALRWVMFLRSAADRATDEGKHTEFAAPFSADAAIRLISQVYDIAYQDAVLDHFEDSESSDDESDEGDSDSEANDPDGGDGWTGAEPNTDTGEVIDGADFTVTAADPDSGALDAAALDAVLDSLDG